MTHCLQRNTIGIHRNLLWLKTLLHCVIYSVKIYFPVRTNDFFLKEKKHSDQIRHRTNFVTLL